MLYGHDWQQAESSGQWVDTTIIGQSQGAMKRDDESLA
jgi:hypothetical protein